MRFTSKKGQGKDLGFKTFVEIKLGLAAEAERIGDELGLRAITSRGLRVPDKAHVLNWLSAAFLDMTSTERDSLIKRGQKVFERLQESDKPLHFSQSSTVAPGNTTDGRSGHQVVSGSVSLPDRKGKPKGPKKSVPSRKGTNHGPMGVE